MKKILLLICLFCAGKSFAQFPINAATGTPTTTVLTRGISAADSGYWYRTAFADTTALNRGRIDEIPGVLVRTSDNSLWLRNNAATAWIQVAGSSGSVNIYNSDGTQTGNRIVTGGGYTLAFDAQSSIRLQPSGSNRTSLLYMDIDSIRLEPPFGILTIDSLASGASTDSVLVWTQATGRVKKRSYSSFTPTWQQTLTAGSTLTGDNTIAGGGNSILWNGFNDFEVLSSGAQLFKADFGGYSAQVGVTQGLSVTIGTYDVGIPGHNSALEIYADSIGASPYSGRYAIDTLNNLSNQNTLLGRVNNISAPNGNGHGNIGYVTLGSGLSLSSGVLNTSGTVPTPISSLTAATGTNDINNLGYAQTWRWNSKNTYGLQIMSTTTSDASSQALLHVELDGANASPNITSFGFNSSIGHTGTNSTNIAGRFQATGGTNNYAIIVPASSGSVGIGTSTPTEILHVVGNIKGTNYIELTDVSAPSTPSSGFGRIYVRADSLRFKNDGGTEFTMGTGGGSSTSPAGNFGNLQINRNGAFATPASDSLDFESATGLSVKGDINSTTLGVFNGQNANKVYIGSASGFESFPGIWFGSSAPNITSYAFLADIAGGKVAINANSGAYVVFRNNNNDIASVTSVGFGVGTTSPTAKLHIAAGTASASTAPLKLTTGTSLTTAEAGAFEYTTPQLFFTNGAAIRQEIPQIQQARVSTQYDNTTTTLGTVTGLTTNVAAGKTYRFEAVLYTTSNVAGGVKFAMAGTATATNIIYEAVVIDNNVNAAQTRATALATTVGAVTAVTNAYAKITGTITVNAAGTFLVQAAANAAVGTTSVLVGSTFVITEML